MAQVDRRTFERLRSGADGTARRTGRDAVGVPDAATWKTGSGLGGTAKRLRLGEVPRGMLVAVALLALLAVVLGILLIGSRQRGFVLTREEAPQAVSQGAGLPVSGESASIVSGGSEGQAEEREEDLRPMLWVHVAGAVCNPGVYELPEGARVVDAVEAAGGFAPDADPDAINLAQPVTDGCKVPVPFFGQASTFDSGVGGADAGEVGVSAGLVNINVADAAALQTLPGIGGAIATEIVRDREQNGPFAFVEDLMRVSGIGEKKFDALSALVTV